MLLLQGAHRGGAEVVSTMTQDQTYGHHSEMTIADPFPGRSRTLAAQAASRLPGLAVRSVELPGDRALRDLDEGARVSALCVSDTPTSVLTTLAARAPDRTDVIWQLLGRTSPGTPDRRGLPIAFQGVVVRGSDQDSRMADSTALLRVLETLAPPASSQRFAGDPLALALLAPLRRAVTAKSLRNLGQIDWDPTDLAGGHLAVVQGTRVVPMVPAITEGAPTYGEQVAVAREAASRLTGPEPRMAVALIGATPGLRLIFVDRGLTGKRNVSGILDLPKHIEPALLTD